MMTKRGRQFGAWPQQHLRIACDLQELREIHEAVPDTRRRAVVLLALPTIIEELLEVELRTRQSAVVMRRIPAEGKAGEVVAEIIGQLEIAAVLAREALVVLKGEN